MRLGHISWSTDSHDVSNWYLLWILNSFCCCIGNENDGDGSCVDDENQTMK